MSNSNEQNGRQPSVPQTAPPTDPRTRNVTSSEQRSRVCRDYVWGICTKGTQCIFRHERSFESMKAILKFCNDHQNRTGCTRQDCTYLHTTREEKDAFLNNRQIPRVLAERYAGMSSTSPNMGAEGMPQMMYMSQPPPPPPPVAASMPPPPPPAQIPILAPPPPPPPPTTSTTAVRVTAPTYTTSASQKMPVLFPVSQPPPPIPALPVIFDASRPPPPVIQQCNGAQKRPAEPCEAGPSKTRRSDNSNVVDSLCDNCVQREIRIELYRQEMQKLHCEKEYKTLIFEKKTDEYERAKLMLKAIVSPDLFQRLEEYVEGIQLAQIHDILSQLNQTPTFSGTSQLQQHTQKPLIIQLFECLIGNDNLRVDAISSPTVNIETFLQSLNALARTRTNPTSSVSDTPTELLHTVLDLLRNANSVSERTPAVEPEIRPSTSGVNSLPNGLNRFNGHKAESSSPKPSASRYPTASGPVPPTTYPNMGAGGSATQVAAPPSAYIPYQPAVPPPTVRPYYAQTYPSTSTNVPNANPPYNPAVRVGVTPLAAVRPTTSTAATPAAHNGHYNQYAMGRYPTQPHYFPPYQ